MSQNHRGWRRQSLLLSGVDVDVGVNVDGDGAVISSPAVESTLVASTVTAALSSLCVGNTYVLAMYLIFFCGGYDILAVLSTVPRRLQKRRRLRPLWNLLIYIRRLGYIPTKEVRERDRGHVSLSSPYPWQQ